MKEKIAGCLIAIPIFLGIAYLWCLFMTHLSLWILSFWAIKEPFWGVMAVFAFGPIIIGAIKGSSVSSSSKN